TIARIRKSHDLVEVGELLAHRLVVGALSIGIVTTGACEAGAELRGAKLLIGDSPLSVLDDKAVDVGIDRLLQREAGALFLLGGVLEVDVGALRLDRLVREVARHILQVAPTVYRDDVVRKTEVVDAPENLFQVAERL